MLITEFIIPMPLTISEYERGYLYAILETSRRETRKGAGVEVLVNEPFDNYPLLGGKFKRGQYTKKVYHVAKKMPKFIAKLAPASAFILHEDSWNSYPFCRTILTNEFMGPNFMIQIDTLHVDKDRGDLVNVHQLDEIRLKERSVVRIDIGDVESSEMSPSENPKVCSSLKTKRGPLAEDWIRNMNPIMTCYKLVTVHFNWFGLQSAIERYIMKTEEKLFIKVGPVTCDPILQYLS